jgi:ATP synthase F1 complex assembly factor 2
LLHRRQQQAWKGLHEFCAQRLDGAKPTTAFGMEGILMSRKRGDEKPNVGLPHPPELTQAAIKWTHSLDAWQLVALNSIATQAKSFLIAFCMLESAGLSLPGRDGTILTGDDAVPAPFADVAQASEASRVEEEFQISCWGLVEGQHDYDRLNSSVQLHSASLFAKTILLER